MNKQRYFLYFNLFFVLFSCTNGPEKNANIEAESQEKKWKVPVKELSIAEYPDNPDKNRMHSELTNVHFDSIAFIPAKDLLFKLELHLDSAISIEFSDFSIKEFIPQIQERLKSDEYLSKIAIINQEWNRNQVKFFNDRFTIHQSDLSPIHRIDIARNCLNSYLWEIIAYADDNGKERACYHGWFNFPQELYSNLFEEVNGIPFAKYESSLVNWVDPESQKIDVQKLREVTFENEVQFEHLNNKPYARIGERDKKHPNIVYPKNTTTIADFLTDSTRFATFSPPGFYDTQSPRVTYLSKLKHLDKVIQRTVAMPALQQDSLLELELIFNEGDSISKTHLLLSGLNAEDFPVLDSSLVHKGWQSSMGFANHTFYETYDHMQRHPVATNPYFAYLADSEGNWIDSHWLGIDGPLFYKDQMGNVNLMLLSFERHAIVGHFIINLQ